MFVAIFATSLFALILWHWWITHVVSARLAHAQRTHPFAWGEYLFFASAFFETGFCMYLTIDELDPAITSIPFGIMIAVWGLGAAAKFAPKPLAAALEEHRALRKIARRH
ncbi:hypothetical protein A3C17_00610 [Candidatus Uhrbacteria bacterium RIFCSPHIGHO2_02_FULL_53_13]|uniref:Uncharacterized protein n=1 Tax=Candidatus Uhrbacteria bacterium RIFCSPHIGHO2_02_FULL_53_13 TaxID=1802389 RepID=A0A1F7TYJ7_9BACT|nr:MAG: hypothetical protein A3C17_00610 [Candidatus Uhrbacteria bacterium RIFCSPHIGHO2_02_FULL_53_13]